MDFCFAKIFIKMVAKLIFERTVMLGIFTGSLVFIKSTKFINPCPAEPGYVLSLQTV